MQDTTLTYVLSPVINTGQSYVPLNSVSVAMGVLYVTFCDILLVLADRKSLKVLKVEVQVIF